MCLNAARKEGFSKEGEMEDVYKKEREDNQ